MPPQYTHEQRVRLSDPWLRSGVEKEWSFSATYNAIVEAGFGYRRSEMLTRWHELEGFAANVPIIESLYYDAPIPYVRHFPAIGDMGNEYRYRTTMTFRDPITGEEEIYERTLLSSKRLPWGEIEEHVISRVPDYQYADWEIVSPLTLTEASRR